jgi:predicted RNA-binding Zn ribbon-like protein
MSEAESLLDHGTGSGTVCLDFANTVDWHSSKEPEDTLGGYAGLVEWSKREGLLSSDEATSLVTKAAEAKKEADEAMDRAVELREAIYRLFSANAHRRQPRTTDLEVLNSHFAFGMSRARLRREGTGYRLGWAGEGRPLDMMLWPIARSAAELLTSEKLVKVKECANEEEGCGWLFLDTSRSQTRVWCSMKSCGNRAKFRRYYRTHSKEQRGEARG